MHVINSRYTYFFKNDISRDPQGSEQSWFFLTKQMQSQWKLWWIRIREGIRGCLFFGGFFSLFFFFKESVLCGMKTLVLSEWIHLSVDVFVCVFCFLFLLFFFPQMDNATCPLHWCTVSDGWGTFGPVGTGNLFLHAGYRGPNRHVIGQDDQYWTLHAELGDKSSSSNNNNNKSY